MSIHDIIEKINADKKEIGFSKWKAGVVGAGLVLVFLVQVGVIICVVLTSR